MKVVLMYASAPRQVREMVVEVPHACSVRQAVRAAGWWDAYPELASDNIAWGIWGRKVDLDVDLREGDRVEAYRALRSNLKFIIGGADKKKRKKTMYRQQPARVWKHYVYKFQITFNPVRNFKYMSEDVSFVFVVH